MQRQKREQLAINATPEQLRETIINHLKFESSHIESVLQQILLLSLNSREIDTVSLEDRLNFFTIIEEVICTFSDLEKLIRG